MVPLKGSIRALGLWGFRVYRALGLIGFRL